MAVFTYSRVPAFNPNTTPVSVARSATGSVYDIGDTGFTTPLNLTLVATNTVTTTLVSDANGMFPDFTLVDRTSVVFKAGSGLPFVLTTTTPVPGPKGEDSTVPGPPGPAITDASLLTAGTVADARLPQRLQETELSATYATPATVTAAVAPKLDTSTATALYVPKAQRGIGPVTFPPRPIVAPITTFQTGHAWVGTVSSGGTNFAADTADYLMGSQSLKATTNGTGGSAEIKAPTQSPALNLTGKGLAFLIKVDNPDRLNYVTLYWGSGNYANFHTSAQLEYQGNGASSRLLPNDWTWVYVPATDFITTTGTVVDSNITDLKVLFVDKNTGPLTVNIQQVGTYTPKTTYPNGVISVTCDDSLLSQYVHLPYIMSRYGAGATMLLIADQMPGTQGFSIDQAHELEDKHGYEMGGHAYTKANHDVGLATLSSQALADELGNLKAWLRTEGFKGSDYFAWPVGSNDVASTKIARRYFSWARHTGGYYAPAGQPSQPMRHQAVTVTSDTPLATFQGYIDYAKLHGRHLTLMVHQILSSGATGPTNVNRNDLINILDYANAQGMPIRTIGQVMRGE